MATGTLVFAIVIGLLSRSITNDSYRPLLYAELAALLGIGLVVVVDRRHALTTRFNRLSALLLVVVTAGLNGILFVGDRFHVPLFAALATWFLGIAMASVILGYTGDSSGYPAAVIWVLAAVAETQWSEHPLTVYAAATISWATMAGWWWRKRA
jgi:hypothetical protein